MTCCSPGAPGELRLHADAAERRLDAEHRPRARSLHAEPAELARRDVDERLQLDAQQEQDHGAGRAAATSNVGNVWFVGSPINIERRHHQVFFDYKSSGCGSMPTRVAMKAFNATGSTFKVGQPRVADINGDGKINANDRTIIGDQLSRVDRQLSNRVTFGGWDLSALVTAKWNYTFVDGTPRSFFGRNGNIADMDYWTPTNPTNKNPAPTTGAARPCCTQSTRALHRRLALAHSQRHARLHDRTRASCSRVGVQQRSCVCHGAGSVHPLELRRHRSRSRRRGADGPTMLLGSNITW